LDIYNGWHWMISFSRLQGYWPNFEQATNWAATSVNDSKKYPHVSRLEITSDVDQLCNRCVDSEFGRRGWTDQIWQNRFDLCFCLLGRRLSKSIQSRESSFFLTLRSLLWLEAGLTAKLQLVFKRVEYYCDNKKHGRSDKGNTSNAHKTPTGN